jgi:hypothetical protein
LALYAGILKITTGLIKLLFAKGVFMFLSIDAYKEDSPRVGIFDLTADDLLQFATLHNLTVSANNSLESKLKGLFADFEIGGVTITLYSTMKHNKKKTNAR